MSNNQTPVHHIVIIGGGPGGYEAALAGRQLGAKVTLIEANGVGGNAVLTDVVPSKSLIATAEAANRVSHASNLGIYFALDGKTIKPQMKVDLGAVNRRLLDLAEAQSKDMLAHLVSEGVHVVRGRGRLDGNHHVIITHETAMKSASKRRPSSLQLAPTRASCQMPNQTVSESSAGPSSIASISFRIT